MATGIYRSQKKYFEQAYRTGEHGWPVEEPSGAVVGFLDRFVKEMRGGRLLDIGCGEGRHAAYFAQRGFQAIGLDDQPLALARAKGLHPNGPSDLNLQFILGDVFQLPFKPDFFDVVLDYGCLHHVRIRDTESYLRNVVPVLKAGGYFMLSCFSTHFKHHPEERRSRNWLVHKGHYDRFFRKGDFKPTFGGKFDILQIEEERQSLHAFFHLLMRKK